MDLADTLLNAAFKAIIKAYFELSDDNEFLLSVIIYK